MEATLQGIFRAGFNGYKAHHGLSMDQHRAAQSIMACRSEALGYEEWGCEHDAYTERQGHSCRNRSCPRCHGARSHDWLEATRARLLPCDHYHVVFTLPHELNALWEYNRHWCSDHLFKASAETLRQLLADERYLGGEVGLLASLHTWGRTLSFHPHVHVLVTGGGLKGAAWRAVENDFLLPVGVLKAKFRGKWLSWLNAAYQRGELKLPAWWTEHDLKRTLARVAGKSWNVRIQGAYRHGGGVVTYLSRYVHGGPIKDSRLVSAEAGEVCFRYRDHHDGCEKTMELKTDRFMGRVLWHVPVKGQHTVRYYGLYVPGAREKRARVRGQMGEPAVEVVVEKKTLERRCPVCGGPLLHRASARRKISSIRNNRPQALPGTFVQQRVRAARAGPGWPYPDGTAYFFGPVGGRST